jgi:hypothetical protein
MDVSEMTPEQIQDEARKIIENSGGLVITKDDYDGGEEKESLQSFVETEEVIVSEEVVSEVEVVFEKNKEEVDSWAKESESPFRGGDDAIVIPARFQG